MKRFRGYPLLLCALAFLSWASDLGRSTACAQTATLNPKGELQRIRDAQRRERWLSEPERQLFDTSYKQGIMFISQGHWFEEAIRSFLTCLKLDPDDYFARLALGQCYLRTGWFPEAAKTFQLAGEKAPDQTEARYFLGVTRMRIALLNRSYPFSEAIPPLKEAIDLAPEYPDTNWNLMMANWNLMIACRQAGIDPNALEERHRLRLAPFFPPSHEPVRFTDVGPQAGVALVNMGRGSAWRDLDDDGDLDLFTVAEGSSHALFQNNGEGAFTDITRRAGVADTLGGWSALWIDYDNDGAPDIFVTRDAWNGRGTNTLYHNNGDGTFTDVTRQAGMEGGDDSFCAAWGDYDNDGWLDLYVAHGVSQGGWPNALYHNNGDGTFTDVARQAGVDDGIRPTVGAVWGDYDNDGYLDLYAVNFRERNSLYHNNRDGTFTDVTAAAGVANPYKGFVAFFFDYDNDGRLDLFVSNWTERMEEVIQSLVTGEPVFPGSRPALYHNNGDGTFTDVTRQAGLARTFGTMAATFGDVDNDGYQDIYLANGGPPMDRFEPDGLFLNNGDGTFADVTDSAGVGNIGKGHGTTMVDYDNDGDLDIYAPEGGMGGNPGDRQPNSLYRNEGNRNHWLKVKLEGGRRPHPPPAPSLSAGGEGGGKKGLSPLSGEGEVRLSNRDGVGARVIVKVGNAIRYAEVSGGCGFGVTNSLWQHFGLGEATRAEAVEVRWPGGLIDRVIDVPADRMLTIEEAGRTVAYRESP